MAKVLEKTIKKTDYSNDTISRLVVLNNSLTERVDQLTTELSTYKDKLDQVASRLGL